MNANATRLYSILITGTNIYTVAQFPTISGLFSHLKIWPMAAGHHGSRTICAPGNCIVEFASRTSETSANSVASGGKFLARTEQLESSSMNEDTLRCHQASWVMHQLHGDFGGNIIHKRWIFHCHVWLPDGIFEVSTGLMNIHDKA